MAVVINLDPNGFGNVAYAIPGTTPPVMSDEAYNKFLNEFYQQVLLQNFKNYYSQDATVSGQVIVNVLNQLIEKYYIDKKSLNINDYNNTQPEFHAKVVEIREKATKSDTAVIIDKLKSSFSDLLRDDDSVKANIGKITEATLQFWLKNDVDKFITNARLDLGIDPPASLAQICPDVTIDGLRFSGTIDTKDLISDPNDNTIKYVNAGGANIKLIYDRSSNCYKIDPTGITADIIKSRFPELKTVSLLSAESATNDDFVPAGSPQDLEEVAKGVLDNFNRFEQQCILLRNMKTFVDRSDRNKDFPNIVCLDVDNNSDAQKLTNLINGSRHFKPFVNIENAVLSSLVPKLKLIKSYTLANGKTLDVELPMEEFVNPEDLLRDNLARGLGFGLESFSWENTSFNEADRNISANIVLKFSNIDSFSKVRKGRIIGETAPVDDKDKFEDFKFLELIYQLASKVNEKPKTDEEARSIQNNAKFKIKVAVGWSYNDNILKNLLDNNAVSALKKAIDSNNTIFYLYNKGHDIRFEKDGSVLVTINYRSAQEARLNDEERANVLAYQPPLKDLEELDKKIESKIEDVKNSNQSSRSTLEKQLDDLQKKKQLVISNTNFEIYSKFLDKLFNNALIRVASIKVKDLVNLKLGLLPTQNKKPVLNIKFETEFEGEACSDARRTSAEINKLNDSSSTQKLQDMQSKIEKLKELLVKSDSTKKVIPYFYLGDLLDIIVQNINDNEPNDEDIIRMITGPFVYNRLKSTSIANLQNSGDLSKDGPSISFNANIADIPVSFEFFMTWFEEQVIIPRRNIYTLKNFLSNMLSTFITNVLSPKCFGQKFLTAPVKSDIMILNSTLFNGKDRLTGIIPKERKIGKRIKLTETVKSALDQSAVFSLLENTKVIPYVYLQMVYVDSKDKFFIDETQNAKDGIYHLKLGVDRGLVKEINFTKDDLPSVAPLVFARQGTVNPRILRTPYNAEVSMVGNTIFKPGSMVYIDPTFALSIPSLKRETANIIGEIGLGGFYIVYRTNNVIRSGVFNTEISCRFVNYGTMMGDPANG